MNKKKQVCRCCTLVDFKKVYLLADILSEEVDHRVPIALGGHHCVKNLQTLTHERHLEKTKKDIARMAEVRRTNKLLRAWR